MDSFLLTLENWERIIFRKDNSWISVHEKKKNIIGQGVYFWKFYLRKSHLSQHHMETIERAHEWVIFREGRPPLG
jgi:hypothetical protein